MNGKETPESLGVYMMVPYLPGIYILEALEPVNNECHVQFGHHLFGLLELLLRSRSQRIRTSVMVLNCFHLRITIGPGEGQSTPYIR